MGGVGVQRELLPVRLSNMFLTKEHKKSAGLKYSLTNEPKVALSQRNCC